MLTTVAVADKLGARLVQIACYGYLRTCAYRLEHYHCPLHMSRREKEEHFQHEAEHLAKASQALERLCFTRSPNIQHRVRAGRWPVYC